MTSPSKIGILALQGDFEAHARTLAHLGVEPAFVKTPADLVGLSGVILPGGESTTQLKLMQEEGLFDALKRFASGGGAVFATCAGAILVAREVRNPAQESLGLADIVVTRNAYGRQISSDVRMGTTELSSEPVEMVFIRAPIIEKFGKDVRVLGECDGRPVLVEQGKLLVATFHPELTTSTAIHAYFLKKTQNGA